MPSDLLLQQNFVNFRRRELTNGLASGKHGQLDPPEFCFRLYGFTRIEAELDHFRSYITQLPALAGRTDSHFPDELFGKVEGGFHAANFPAYQLSVKAGAS